MAYISDKNIREDHGHTSISSDSRAADLRKEINAKPGVSPYLKRRYIREKFSSQGRI